MIELQNVSFGYGRTPLIRDLSCQLRDGEITAIIGPNGAGKSTLLRLCARLLLPQSGSVSVGEKDARQYDPRAFARTLAFLPQSRPLPMIAVQELVMHGRYAHLGAMRRPGVEDRTAVEKALAMTGMESLAQRELRTLSGGQRQMAYIAMLIAQEAQHILLDEPLTFLDVGVQLALTDVLRSLRSEGRCIGLVVHDLALVPQLCDHVLLLQEGQLAYDGTELDAVSIERAFGVRAVRREGWFFERK